jgi:hypothetical protein
MADIRDCVIALRFIARTDILTFIADLPARAGTDHFRRCTRALSLLSRHRRLTPA